MDDKLIDCLQKRIEALELELIKLQSEVVKLGVELGRVIKQATATADMVKNLADIIINSLTKGGTQ